MPQRVVNKKTRLPPHLPIQFAIVDHGDHPQRLDLDDGTHGERPRSDLDDVDGIVIPEALQFRMLLVGVLPRLGQATVIPEDRSVVIAELPLLDVLGDGVVRFLRRDLHLRLGHLGDLDHGVVRALGRRRLEGDVVPGGDRRIGGSPLPAGGEGESEGFGRLLPHGRRRVGVQDRRGDEGARRVTVQGPGRGGGPCRRRRRGE